ncbi:hypothetical protein [Arthrobacter sp. SX1312]|uniref:hypothetical protein n=1 Tax=Arthrobacter sp. SX1312 TaxID=2058896 RepID=UPI0011AFFE7D|nr:hypothetical protein [Arthrobacter sp. SX1312]
MQRMMSPDGSQRLMTLARLKQQTANEAISPAELERLASIAPGFITYLERRRRQRVHPLGTRWREYVK